MAGRVSSLFDISLGFEPEANGWDNIRFRSYLQGETPRTVRPACRPSPTSANWASSSTCRSALFVGHARAAGVFRRHGHRAGDSHRRRGPLGGRLRFQAKARQRMQALISPPRRSWW